MLTGNHFNNPILQKRSYMTTRRIAVQIIVMAILVLLTGSLYTSSAANAASQIDQDMWRDVEEASITPSVARQIIPNKYRTIAADLAALDALLASTPQENTAVESAEVVLPLPLPDGTFGRFRIQEYAMMEPGLAAKFPEIKTYLGQGVDDPTATVHLDRTPAGFHGMILSSGDTIYIDPYSRGDITHYISYFKRDFDPGISPLASEIMVDDPAASRLPDLSAVTLSPSGSQLRIYRTAVAATGEYTQFHGGTVSAGMAAIVTSINRVTGIYEREVAVRLILVANNNLVVYTNPATDPYTNNNGGAMLSQNQTNLDNVIGSANYDLGHVFSTGGGGIASLAVTCRAGLKARGVTGSPQPIGDPFDVDYVAHEIGHQFGANHTFNGTTASCSGGNRNASTAYEPGSGSTIMAYAGICGAENLQPNSDDDFHTISYDEILAYTTIGAGNTCPVINATGNSAPVVDAGASFTIPQQTPFTLTGSATDPNGDSLTYSWEQFDLGAASPPNTDNGNRPIFRVFNPVTSPSRTFPKLSNILNNTSTLGESLPTTTRVLTFRLMVRDNRVGGGGVDYDTVTLNVTSAAGPFIVTAPNTAVTWSSGSLQTVTWNVASTNLSPVTCPSVNILLSTDGGNAFSTTLASGTPNDGTQTITVPNVSTTTARVKVECANNIFFDISNANFTITSGGPTATPTATLTATNTPEPGATMHVGDLDGSSTINGNRWNANVLVTIHNASENPVANATINGSWSNGTSGSGSCVTNGSGQCTISKNNLRNNVNSVTFTVNSVTHASNTYQSGGNHDPDGDSNGTSIIVFKDGPPEPTATPGPTVTPVPGVAMHVGDLDGSATTLQSNRWSATVTITVHNASEGPIAGASASGSWSNGTSGSVSCVTNASGQCAVTKNNLRGNISSVTFTVNNVTSAGNTYNASANHDPDGDSNGTTIIVSQP
jgi:hypothetical protein